MNFFERNELELTEKLLLSEGGGVSEGGVNYCTDPIKTIQTPTAITKKTTPFRYNEISFISRHCIKLSSHSAVHHLLKLSTERLDWKSWPKSEPFLEARQESNNKASIVGGFLPW